LHSEATRKAQEAAESRQAHFLHTCPHQDSRARKSPVAVIGSKNRFPRKKQARGCCSEEYKDLEKRKYPRVKSVHTGGGRAEIRQVEHSSAGLQSRALQTSLLVKKAESTEGREPEGLNKEGWTKEAPLAPGISQVSREREFSWKQTSFRRRGKKGNSRAQ